MGYTLLLIFGIVLLNITAYLFLKKGVLSISEQVVFSFSRIFELLPHILLNGYIVSSILFLGISFVLWLFLIARAQLSVAYPVAISLNLILILIVSRVFFKEPIFPLQIIGIGVIIIGIFLVLKGQ